MQHTFLRRIAQEFVDSKDFASIEETNAVHNHVLSDVSSIQGGRGGIAVRTVREQMARQPDGQFVTIVSAGRWTQALREELKI